MLSLDSSKWHDLKDAYGSADKVPNILRRLYADPTDKDALDEAWGSLCHQGTIYTASIAAAPHLVSLVTNMTLRDRLGPLILVGSIAESLAKSTERLEADADLEEYRAEAIELLTESIKFGGLMDYELRHSLSALAALLGDSKLASLLSNADCGIECPKCGTEIDLLESSLVD
jgi:hypothetical protein